MRDVDGFDDTPCVLGGWHQQPVVRADEDATLGESQRDRSPRGADVRIDHRDAHPGRRVRQRAPEVRAPARTSWRGTPCVMSITRASGQMSAITA